MADAKITALTANTSPLSTDIIPMVDDPAGTPVTQKMTLDTLNRFINTSGSYTTTATAAGTTTLDNTSNYYQFFTGSTTQTVVLPNATTLTVGHRFYIDNDSTGTVTIQTNGGATLYTLTTLQDVLVVCTSVGSAAGSWDVNPFFKTNVATTLTAPMTLVAGTTTIAPVTFQSGTLLTTAAAGAKEFLDGIFYQTGAASNRRVDVGMYFTSNTSDFTGANTTAAQPIFAAANDTFTAEANTSYFFDLFLSVTNGTTTATKALVFGGTATYSKVRYNAIGQNVAVNTTGTTQSTAHVDRATSTVILATGTTSWFIRAQGIIRISTGGTIVPQFAFSADPGGTVLVKSESFFRLTPIGSNTAASVGNWA